MAPPQIYYPYLYYYYSILVPAVSSSPFLPQFFPCSPPLCSVHNPIYPFHCPLILSPPSAHAAPTTAKNSYSHDNVGMSSEVKNNKRSSITARRYCRNSQKISPRKVKALSPTLMWKPKTIKVEMEGKTTVMVKNIPNNMRRKALLEFLDKHCFHENQKNRNMDGHVHVPSEYDFVYLLMDFSSGLNLGYAFVNFTNAVAANRFYHSCQNKKWEGFDSGKICEIKLARIQGKEQLVKNFAGSYFMCHSDEFLPAVFKPPRNGGANSTSPSYLGRRWSKK